MDVRGLVKFSLVDYPGKICGILFLGGCNFRCPFCHNPCLVLDPASQPRVTEKELRSFFKRRGGLIEGMVISGGEPTLQKDLPELSKMIKNAGLCVKLDTNGTNPEMISQLFEAGTLDALGIDYKAPASDYAKLCGNSDPAIPDRIHESIAYALAHGIELDVRTTVHRDLLSEKQLETMRGELVRLGVKTWVLQQYHPVEVLDDELSHRPTYEDHELAHIARGLIKPEMNIRVRGLTGRMIL